MPFTQSKFFSHAELTLVLKTHPCIGRRRGRALMLKRDADQPLTGRITRFKKARFRIGCERALISRLSCINHHAVPRILFVKRLCNSLCLLLRWLAMPSYQE